MRNDDVRMLLGAMGDFRDNRIANKRWAEKQLLEQAMSERDEARYQDQIKLQQAMQERQIRRMDEDSERWEKNFARDENRYLAGIIDQSVRDKIESDRYAEQAAARNAATQHGQKMDLSKLDLAMMEHELRKQQSDNQPIGTAQYGWGTDEDGNPAYMPMSQTMNIYRGGVPASGGQAAQASAGSSATQTAPSTPSALAAPSTQQVAPATTSSEAAPSELQPNPKASTFWSDFGKGALATTKWLTGANIVPALANSGVGKAVRAQYNEAKEDRAYHRAVQDAQVKPAQRNYAQQQAIDFLKLGAEPFVAAGSAMKPAWDASVSTVADAYAANKTDRAKHRAAQLEAEERELRRRAERLDALKHAQY